MAEREAVLHVKVLDKDGNERPPGEVKVNGAALSHDATDGFVHKLTSSGDIKLVVVYSGFVALEQWFEVDAPAERPKLSPFWPGTDSDTTAAPNLRKAIDAGKKRKGYLLDCMDLLRTAAGDADARSPSVFTLSVHLDDAREHVAVIGSDYWEHAGRPDAHRARLDFDRYSLTYLKQLIAQGRVNASSPYTVVSCQRGVIEQWMKVKGKGYKRQTLLMLKDPAPTWPTAKDFLDWKDGIRDGTVDGTRLIGALDMYQYLSGVGFLRPGTVVDLGIFSHAWAGGPIFFNTTDPDHEVPWRDPHDFDPRPKDFGPLNAIGYPALKQAFTGDAEIHVWGCFATTLYRHMTHFLSARRGTTRFKETLDKLSYDLSRAEVISRLERAMDISYMQAFATFTGLTTFGGPPGCGAENIDYADVKDVPAKLRKKVGSGKILHVPGAREGADAREVYTSAEMGNREFDWFSYMKYEP